MSKEIERKFKLKRVPSDLIDHIIDQTLIVQDYLAISDTEEVRIRKSINNTNNLYYLTIKTGCGLEREENDILISEQTYSSLHRIGSKPIVKERFLMVVEGVRIELDVYLNDLEGLVIAEIEFYTMQQAIDFKPPAWLGEDVTEDEQYKNKNLWIKINGGTV